MESRKYKIVPITALLVFILLSCNPATPTQEPIAVATATPATLIESTPTLSADGLPQTEADVPRVSVEDTAAAIKNGEAIVMDVRSAQAYQASHIPGALSIPLFDIESNPASVNLDKDRWIITYCT